MPDFSWTPWWGTAPEWLAALGTVGAFFAGLRLLRKELDARREHEEDRRRAQASRVACWLGMIEDPDWRPSPTQGQFQSRPRSRVVAAILHNGSEEPVYDCEAHLELDPTATWDFSDGERRLTLTERVLPPGRIEHKLGLPRAEIPHVSTWMIFTDAAGHRWTRPPNGQLEGSPESRRSVKDRLDGFAKGQMDELDARS